MGGVVQVENENHCDFTRLREMLIRTNMEDLIDTTHARHYELYRKDRLKQMGFEENNKDGKPSSFAETYTMRRENHLQSLQEGGRDEAEVRPQSEGEGGRVEGSRERTS